LLATAEETSKRKFINYISLHSFMQGYVLIVAGIFGVIIIALVSTLVYPLVVEAGLSREEAPLVASGLGQVVSLLFITPLVCRVKALRNLLKKERAVERGVLLYIACASIMLTGGYLISRFTEAKYKPYFQEANFTYAIPILLLVAPLTEELIFRGLILYGLKKYLGNTAAAILSSLIFALLHFRVIPLPLLLLLFADAILLSYFVLKWENLTPSIIAHTLINLQALLIHQA